MSHVNRFIAVVAVVLSLQFSFAQTYTFTRSQATYQELTNPVSVNQGEYWDNFSYFILPFNVKFPFFNKMYDTLVVSSGSVSFSFTVEDDIVNLSGQEIGLFATYADLKSRGDGLTSESPIGYTITGQSGSRIFKLQWKNAGLAEDETGTNFINMQLWLYEGSGVIEMRYGPSTVNNPAIYFPGTNGPLIGFYDDDPTKGYYLRGNPGNPTVVSSPPFPALNGIPPNGTVYRFTPSTSRLTTLQEAGYSVFPNPFVDEIHIQHPQEVKAGKFRLMDMTGRVLSNQSFYTNWAIQISDIQINPGVYLIEVQIGTECLQGKLIKAE